ncbi:MAG: hypothetical protein KC468_10885 [Myxococcales bacterium]|nr:hypothetical protein [Myxococcales bacterium]
MRARWIEGTCAALLLLGCAGDDGDTDASETHASTAGTSAGTTDSSAGATDPSTVSATEPATDPTTAGATDSTSAGSTDSTSASGTDATDPSSATETSETSQATEDPTDATTTGVGDCDVSDVLSQADWDEMFLHKDDPACSGVVYTYQGLLDAAEGYPLFACEGGAEVRAREVAAFLAQISHETTGGWPQAPDGPYAWGLCFIEEVGCENNACPQYCDANNMQYPCAPGKTYHGRGAIQLSWNYNYGQAGDALGVDILANPELVASDSALALQTALWFWMTEQLPKPSAHDVMVGNWTPTPQDESMGRVPGFGMTTNIVNGGLECGMPTPPAVADRVGFFMRYADLLAIDPGENLYCDQMAPYL